MGCACNQKEPPQTDDNTGDQPHRPPSYDEARRDSSQSAWAPCFGAPPERGFDTQIEFPVTVHIYHLDRVSWLLSPLGLSAYHSEVDIMGTVFAFGAFGKNEETREYGVEQSGRFAIVLRLPLCITPHLLSCLLYTSPSPRDRQKSRMPSSA